MAITSLLVPSRLDPFPQRDVRDPIAIWTLLHSITGDVSGGNVSAEVGFSGDAYVALSGVGIRSSANQPFGLVGFVEGDFAVTFQHFPTPVGAAGSFFTGRGILNGFRITRAGGARLFAVQAVNTNLVTYEIGWIGMIYDREALKEPGGPRIPLLFASGG